MLRVMSFNIRIASAGEADPQNAWTHRADACATAIASSGCDVVGIQDAEPVQLAFLNQALPEYTVLGVGRDDGQPFDRTERVQKYAPLLVNTATVTVLEHKTSWFSETPTVPGSRFADAQFPSVCTQARLQHHGTCQPFVVFNAHYDNPNSKPRIRTRSSERLMQWIVTREHPSDPVIVTGDFIAGERTKAFRRLLQGPEVLVDTYRVIFPGHDIVRTFHGFAHPSPRRPRKMDAVLASSHWTVIDAAIDREQYLGRYPSDHYPVHATLSLKSVDGPPHSKRPPQDTTGPC